MAKQTTSTAPTPKQTTLGDKLRGIADQLKQETDVQIKATSRILGAAAQIAENHDRLIDEVVEMVEQDLEEQEQAARSAKAIQSIAPSAYTVEALQQQFKTLNEAKQHFGIKANGWAALVSKLNQTPSHTPSPPASDNLLPRIEAVEQELKALRTDVAQILSLSAEILALIRQK